MVRRTSDWDDEYGEDDLDEREYPDPDDGDDDELSLVACPNCRAEIYEDAVQCPHCGEYVTHGRHPLGAKPLWYVLLALAGIAAVIWVLLP